MYKKAYSKPQIISEKLNAGVFGSYGSGGGGSISMLKSKRTDAVLNFGPFCCEKNIWPF
ncbi:MAG: hypothetical protein JXR70_01215 [Spirochaetales bacterium]|nr:hypothetical protein [Spirochaetales bacterium]